MTAKRRENTPPLMGAHPSDGSRIVCPAGLEDMAEFLLLIELQFFVQMGLAGDADRVLESYGYGRAHHRALYFTARQLGIASSELSSVLAISNQALAKVMKTLIADGLMAQVSDPIDRRIRRCSVTSAGLDLLRQVFSAQKVRFDRALAATSPKASEGHIALYRAMLNPNIVTLPG